jgi:hypothetical protein
MSNQYDKFFEVMASNTLAASTPPATLGAPYLTAVFEGLEFGAFDVRVPLDGVYTLSIVDESEDNHYILAWGISPQGNKAVEYYEDDAQGYIKVYSHPDLVELFSIDLVDYDFNGLEVGRKLIWSRDERYVTFFATLNAVPSALMVDVTFEEMVDWPLPSSAEIDAAAFSIDGSLVAFTVTQASPAGYFLLVYSTDSLGLVASAVEIEGPVDHFRLIFDADNNIIYSVAANGTLYKRTAASDWATVSHTKVYSSPTFASGPLAFAFAGPAIGHIYSGVGSGSPTESARIDCLDSTLTAVNSFEAGNDINGGYITDLSVSYNGNFLAYGQPQVTASDDVLRLYAIVDVDTYTLEYSRGHVSPFPTSASHVFLGGDDQPA